MDYETAGEIRTKIDKILNMPTNLKDTDRAKLKELIGEYGSARADEREMDLNEG